MRPIPEFCVAGDPIKKTRLQLHIGTGERMKKILLGTSALAMAGAFAGQANAATWDLDWGGYYEASIAYASSDRGGDDDGFDGVDVLTDSEIIFTPSITLDNGLTFGVDIQLEGTSGGTGDRIDESFAFVKGSFGQVLIGSENSAGYKMMYGAPDVTWINVNSGSGSVLIPGIYDNDVFRGTGGSSFVEVGRNNDAERITYFTPRFSGFQLGVSYARDGNESSGFIDDDASGVLHDIFDIGANYVNSFGAFDIAIAGRYGTATLEDRDGTPGTAGTPRIDGIAIAPNGRAILFNGPAPVGATVVRNPVAATAGTAGTGPNGGGDPEVWAVGLNLGYGGFKIGGSYAKSDDSGYLAQDGTFFDLGVSYTTGPWGMSFTYSKGENEVTAGGPDSELDQYIAGVTYKLGPGVTAGAYAGYADFDAPGGDAGDIDGFYVGTGFKLNF